MTRPPTPPKVRPLGPPFDAKVERSKVGRCDAAGAEGTAGAGRRRGRANQIWEQGVGCSSLFADSQFRS